MAVLSPVGRVGDVNIVIPTSTINFRNHRPCFILIVQYFDGPAIDVSKAKNKGGEFCVVFCKYRVVSCCVSITQGDRGILGFCTEKLQCFGFVVRFNSVSGFSLY